MENEIGYFPHSIPFSNKALFSNLSEKERFIKISTEFNKVKAQIDAHRHEDYDISFLVSFINNCIEFSI